MYNGNVYLDSLRHYKNNSFFLVGHRKSKSSWWTIRQWYSIFICAGLPHSSVEVWVRQLSAPAKEHKGVVRRQDENSLRALHYLASGHAFDCATGFAISGGDTGKRGAKSVNILTSKRRNTTIPRSLMFWLTWLQIYPSCLHPLPINATAFNA